MKPRITPADVKRVCAHAGITRHQFAASIPRRPNGPTWPTTGNEVSRILNGTCGYGLHVAEAYVGAITAALERLQAQIYEPPKRTFACTDEEWEAAAPRPQTGRA